MNCVWCTITVQQSPSSFDSVSKQQINKTILRRSSAFLFFLFVCFLFFSFSFLFVITGGKYTCTNKVVMTCYTEGNLATGRFAWRNQVKLQVSWTHFASWRVSCLFFSLGKKIWRKDLVLTFWHLHKSSFNEMRSCKDLRRQTRTNQV